MCNWVLLLTPVVAGQPGSSKVLPSKSQVYSYFATVQCKSPCVATLAQSCSCLIYQSEPRMQLAKSF